MTIPKIDNGVVSVTSLWADERVYYPSETEPYTPEHSFPKGKNDPNFRTKLKLALQLVQKAVEQGWPFRAVVADNFYGEDRSLKQELRALGVPYVMALKPSHAWYHPEEVAGTLQDVAHEAGWESAKSPGKWISITRAFRDGSTQQWWALEVIAGPYGPDKTQRAVVATTDPETLPDLTTWYVVTNLPAPSECPVTPLPFPPASLEEVIRLYGLRQWVEQSYKQIKHALGWSQYQVRSDQAIRRHWQLVCCAFSFCWYHASHGSSQGSSEPKAATASEVSSQRKVPADAEGMREKNRQRVRGKRSATTDLLADGPTGSPRLVGALDHAQTLLARLVATTPTSCVAAPS